MPKSKSLMPFGLFSPNFCLSKGISRMPGKASIVNLIAYRQAEDTIVADYVQPDEQLKAQAKNQSPKFPPKNRILTYFTYI